jgi:enoyl-CoA hydratase/carnithine racemase
VSDLLVDRDDGVVTLTLNRPDKKNAITGSMWGGLREVFEDIANNCDDRVLVVTGAGDAFCAGADLIDAGMPRSAGGRLAHMRGVGRSAAALRALAIPTVAKVNGVAAGAGVNLAIGCDLVIASDRARFSEIFVQRGLSIDYGGSWLLPRLVGIHKAKELALLAEVITAADAERIGIVNRVVPADDLAKITTELAARLAALPPIQLSLSKRLLNQSFSVSMADALEFEDTAQAMNFASKDTAEAMVAFLQKRDPKFTGE